MAGHSMQPIPVLAEYFGGDGNPVIRETFVAERGWRRLGWHKRASRAYLRKLRREEGVTHVAVSPATLPERVADFRIEELV